MTDQDPIEVPIEVPIEDVLDLHSFPPRDIPAVVEGYVEAARAAGWTTLRLIHGRGRGVQRAHVIALVSKLPGVVAAREAPAELGGWGATIVDLAPLGETDAASIPDAGLTPTP